jgi:hypothetical protein
VTHLSGGSDRRWGSSGLRQGRRRLMELLGELGLWFAVAFRTGDGGVGGFPILCGGFFDRLSRCRHLGCVGAAVRLRRCSCCGSGGFRGAGISGCGWRLRGECALNFPPCYATDFRSWSFRCLCHLVQVGPLCLFRFFFGDGSGVPINGHCYAGRIRRRWCRCRHWFEFRRESGSGIGIGSGSRCNRGSSGCRSRFVGRPGRCG